MEIAAPVPGAQPGPATGHEGDPALSFWSPRMLQETRSFLWTPFSKPCCHQPAHSGLNRDGTEPLLKIISLTPLQILLQLVWLFSISLLSTDFPLLLKTSSTGCGSSCEGLCKQQHCQVSCTSAQPVTALASAPCHLSSPDVDSCSRAKCYLCHPATVLIQPENLSKLAWWLSISKVETHFPW